MMMIRYEGFKPSFLKKMLFSLTCIHCFLAIALSVPSQQIFLSYKNEPSAYRVGIWEESQFKDDFSIIGVADRDRVIMRSKKTEPIPLLIFKEERHSDLAQCDSRWVFSDKEISLVNDTLEMQSCLEKIQISDFVSLSGQEIFLPTSSSSLKSKIGRPEIKSYIDAIGNSTERIQYYATYLTGEHPDSPIFTRQTYSDSGYTAALWVRKTLTDLGFNATFHSYEKYTAAGRQWNPNIIAEWPATNSSDHSDEIIVVGAHYDDRQYDSSSTTQKAPGANDDGSGSTLVLQLAEWISRFQPLFKKRVILMAFSGEEQGLVGSRAWAREARAVGKKIKMLQADMVGYNSKQGINERMAFIKGYTSKSLTAFARQVTTTYAPELVVTDTNACCSDHQSFHENGFDSVGFVESGGYTVDPEYHHPGDLVFRKGYDLAQILAIGKAVFATLLELSL